ncbi:MAG: hypothetical protein NTV22_05720 [bacterium]|nr:hypothetical protein [bacterium]
MTCGCSSERDFKLKLRIIMGADQIIIVEVSARLCAGGMSSAEARLRATAACARGAARGWMMRGEAVRDRVAYAAALALRLTADEIEPVAAPAKSELKRPRSAVVCAICWGIDSELDGTAGICHCYTRLQHDPAAWLLHRQQQMRVVHVPAGAPDSDAVRVARARWDRAGAAA